MKLKGGRSKKKSKYTKKRYNKKRYSKKRYSKKRYSKKRYSKKNKLRGGRLTPRQQELLTKVEGRGSYCNRGSLPLRKERNEQECNDRNEVCKWGRKDGETSERCMKDEDKILEIKESEDNEYYPPFTKVLYISPDGTSKETTISEIISLRDKISKIPVMVKIEGEDEDWKLLSQTNILESGSTDAETHTSQTPSGSAQGQGRSSPPPSGSLRGSPVLPAKASAFMEEKALDDPFKDAHKDAQKRRMEENARMGAAQLRENARLDWERRKEKSNERIRQIIEAQRRAHQLEGERDTQAPEPKPFGPIRGQLMFAPPMRTFRRYMGFTDSQFKRLMKGPESRDELLSIATPEYLDLRRGAGARSEDVDLTMGISNEERMDALAKHPTIYEKLTEQGLGRGVRCVWKVSGKIFQKEDDPMWPQWRCDETMPPESLDFSITPVRREGRFLGVSPTLPKTHVDYFELHGYIVPGPDHKNLFLFMEQNYPNRKKSHGLEFRCWSRWREEMADYPESPRIVWVGEIINEQGVLKIVRGSWYGCCHGTFEATLVTSHPGLPRTTTGDSSISDNGDDDKFEDAEVDFPQQELPRTTTGDSSISDNGDDDKFEDAEVDFPQQELPRTTTGDSSISDYEFEDANEDANEGDGLSEQELPRTTTGASSIADDDDDGEFEDVMVEEPEVIAQIAEKIAIKAIGEVESNFSLTEDGLEGLSYVQFFSWFTKKVGEGRNKISDATLKKTQEIWRELDTDGSNFFDSKKLTGVINEMVAKGVIQVYDNATFKIIDIE